MARTISIRQSLLWNLVVMIVVMGGAIVATTYVGSRRTVRTLSASIIRQTLDSIDAQLQGFFDDVVRELRVAQSWGEQGLLELTEEERANLQTEEAQVRALRQKLNRQFVPLMNQYPQISSLLVADSRGREHMLLRIGPEWRNRVTRVDRWGGEVRWLEWRDDDESPSTERTEALGYDPRVRPWYVGAVELRDRLAAMTQPQRDRSRVHWTRPYRFFTTREPGITASITYESDDGLDHVIGFDVLLRDISDFTMGLRVSNSGRVFVFTEEMRIIGLPNAPRFIDSQARMDAYLKHPTELGLQLAVDANQALQRVGEQWTGPIRFTSEGEAWWGELRPFHLSPDRRLRIAVLVPEEDLLGNLVYQRVIIVGIVLIVLLVGVLRAIALSGRFSRPIERLVRQSDRISRGDFEKGRAIQSSVTEVRRLAEAQERMRTGLRSLLKLERDLQLARQIQQNTFPEQLPAVRGFEIDAWSEPAEETGGDTYDVLHDAPLADADSDATPSRERVVLLLADATGHGIGPALSVTQVRAMLRMAVRMGGDLISIVEHLNEQLYADLPADRFVTAWLGELDPVHATITGVSAGQAPILLYHAASDDFTTIAADAPPLGIVPQLPLTPPTPMTMKPGDLFAVISDGVFEATDATREQFGPARVQAIIREHRGKPLRRLTEALRTAVDAFTNGAPPDDDRTIILIRRSKKTKRPTKRDEPG